MSKIKKTLATLMVAATVSLFCCNAKPTTNTETKTITTVPAQTYPIRPIVPPPGSVGPAGRGSSGFVS